MICFTDQNFGNDMITVDYSNSDIMHAEGKKGSSRPKVTNPNEL